MGCLGSYVVSFDEVSCTVVPVAVKVSCLIGWMMSKHALRITALTLSTDS